MRRPRQPFCRRARLAAFLTGILGFCAAQAAPVVSIGLKAGEAGLDIPADFSGLSYEMRDVLPGPDGLRLFRPGNTALASTLRALGVRQLRLGGNTTDTPSVPVPGPADLDSLFGFVRAAGVNVIFTLRLRQGDPSAAAAEAKYLMARYAPEIVCFAIGNEPDVYDPTYPKYLADLNRYMVAITRPEVAPSAVFCGPSTTPDKSDWAGKLAHDVGPGRLRLITQHAYPGGSARQVRDPAAARDAMLSPGWLGLYAGFYNGFVPAVRARGLPYRLEETNSYFHGGVKGASDTLAAALWALDYLHWWALHGASGLNFHTGDRVAAADALTPCHYAAFWSAPDGYAVLPVGYALKAFDLGGRGRTVPLAIQSNSDGINLTAYAVRGADGRLFLTLINKEHGPGARAVDVDFSPGPGGFIAQTLTLEAPGSDISARSSVRLGGAPIADNGSWFGTWRALVAPETGPSFVVTVAPASAALVAFTAH